MLIAICNDHQIENGDIDYDPDTTPRTEGNIALYSCVSGYHLSGLSIRVCMDGRNGMEGVWTGSMPSCIGMKTSIAISIPQYISNVLQQSVIVSPSQTLGTVLCAYFKGINVRGFR